MSVEEAKKNGLVSAIKETFEGAAVVEEINTHGMVCDFGKHAGERYTRIPVSYLKWMVNAGHTKADIAAAELKRRGTTTPELEISGHAIDRVSLFCRSIWHYTRNEDEGIHSWLVRVSQEALASVDGKPEGKVLYLGMKFVFEIDGVWPVVKTVMPGTKAQQRVVFQKED